MATENLFGQAVEKNETGDFFLGKGIYFVRDPDGGVHVHGAHLTGWVENYISKNKSCSEVFDNELLNFINSADENVDDIDHVFSTLSAYFSAKDKGLLSDSILFDAENGDGSVSVFKYLCRIKNKGLLTSSMNDILVHAEFIKSKGHSFIVNHLKDLR